MDFFTDPHAASASASVSPAGESNSPAGKNRSACDRCHSQKLRCVRKTGQVTCERCLKLKTMCRFSPRAPRASLKPSEQATGYDQGYWHDPFSMSASTPSLWNTHADSTIANPSDNNWNFPPDSERSLAEGLATINPGFCCPSQGISLDMDDMDWFGFLSQSNMNTLGHNSSIDLDLTPINGNITSYASGFPLAGTSDLYRPIRDCDISGGLETFPASAVQQLAILNIAIYECAKKLPSIEKPGANEAPGSRKATLFAIDELFRLTTNFTNILKSLSVQDCEMSTPSSSIDPEPPEDQSQMSLVSYSQQVSDAGQPRGPSRPPHQPFSDVDEGTMLMVVSCHCRLAEIYLSLFQMMQACIEYSLAPRLGNDWTVILPQLQVGSLAAPSVKVDINTPLSSAKSSMYMLMITMFSSQLWEQLVDVMKSRGSAQTDSAAASRSTLADTVWESMTDKTEELSRTIDATKHMLQRCSVVPE